MSDWGTVKVKRIQEGNYTSAWPEFDPEWSELMQLRWHAALASLDSGTGIPIRVTHGVSKTNGVPRDEFCVNVGNTGYGSAPFDWCWTLITGIGSGLAAAQDHFFPPRWRWVDPTAPDFAESPIYDGVKRDQTPFFEALAAKYGNLIEAS